MFSSVRTTWYWSFGIQAATASKPASGEYSARLKYIGRVVSESVFGLIRWMMRVRTKTSFCPKTGFLLAEPPTRLGSDQADSNLLWARSFRIGTPGSLGRIPNADPPRLPEGRAATSWQQGTSCAPGSDAPAHR